MLSTPEKIIFTILALTSAAAGLFVVRRIVRIVGRGQGSPDWSVVPRRGTETTPFARRRRYCRYPERFPGVFERARRKTPGTGLYVHRL